MTDKIKDSERWVTTKDACEHLGVSRQTLLQWVLKLNLPAHKIGYSWRFKISEINEWVEKHS